MTLEELIAVEDAAFTAWLVIANSSMGMERYDTKEYQDYQQAIKAVNKAVTKKNMGY
jgi:uncharacterized protein involved in propanediol utilization